LNRAMTPSVCWPRFANCTYKITEHLYEPTVVRWASTSKSFDFHFDSGSLRPVRKCRFDSTSTIPSLRDLPFVSLCSPYPGLKIPETGPRSAELGHRICIGYLSPILSTIITPHQRRIDVRCAHTGIRSYRISPTVPPHNSTTNILWMESLSYISP